jgi:hypothetical protein
MANVYSPQSVGVTAPSGGFQQGGWYNGRQYYNGTVSDPGVIHPQSTQVGAGNAVSAEVNAQSAAAQGKTPEQINTYLQSETQKSKSVAPTQTINGNPNGMSGASTTPTSGTGLPTTTPQASIDLPKLYEELYKSAGVKDKESELSQKEKDYITAQGKVNNNPFLSEATRVGRLDKLSKDYESRVANLKNDIATSKADVETKLNLQLKQLDLNNQATQLAWQQFNTLLSSGALNNASGESIANITRSTGISSDMIYSVVNAQKAKDVKTSVIQSTKDDGTVTVSVINSDTGEIIKQSNLGKIGNAEKGTAPKAQTVAEQKASVETSVTSYLGNESFQAQISPEDLYLKLISTYPEAIDYIKTNWSAEKIRKANGEEYPYGKIE